jgi:hypothetical protein
MTTGHVSRRSLLAGMTAAAPAFLLSPQAQAKDEIFKPNPLTNPVLEQIRIWEQAEADAIKYNGELEMGDAGNKGKVDAYPKLLVPILQMQDDLRQVNAMVREPSKWKQAQTILSQSKYDKISFKKIFNAYGDNIYYSDPDRANVYLGGGATPRNEQSLAYLLRNEVLTNIEALKAELDYLLKDSTPASEKNETNDLFQYAKTATTTMDEYIKLVPPNEMKLAKEFMESKS